MLLFFLRAEKMPCGFRRNRGAWLRNHLDRAEWTHKSLAGLGEMFCQL